MAPSSSRQRGPWVRGVRPYARGGAAAFRTSPWLRERVSFCANRPGALDPAFASGYPGAPGAAACSKAQ